MKKSAIIVGSGPSLRSANPSDIIASKATVIAVNAAIQWLGQADFWFTLDASPSNIELMHERNGRCRYIAATPEDVVLPRFVTRYKRIEGDLFGSIRAPGGLSDTKDSINTGNSAFGALGLAYLMGFKKILLLGIDGTQEEKVLGGKPRCLKHLPQLFETAVDQLRAAGVQVVNGSPDSKIECFKKMSIEDGLAWAQ